MLARHVLGYIPSLVVPALMSFAAVYCFTRVMSTEEYGRYALLLNTMTLLNAVFFYWLQVSLPRLAPEAERAGKEAELRVTSYIGFGIASAIMMLLAFAAIAWMPLVRLPEIIWLSLPLTLTRALLNMNLAFHKVKLDFARYNLLECGQSILGISIGLTLVYHFRMGVEGAVLGMIAGIVLMLIWDIKTVLRGSLKDYSRERLVAVYRFGLPLVFSFGFSFIIAASDKYLIGYFRGVAEVGIYAAAYTVMDRIVTALFMVVATPAFPLIVHRLEQEGIEAARRQAYTNGAALLLLAMPACAGLILTTPHLAALFVGPAFQEGVLSIMPWIALAAFLNGLTAHYFDHAFHLAKRPALFFMTEGPSALFNLMLNILLIPRYGFIGAAWAAAGTYALSLVLSILIGRRVMPLPFPFHPAAQILASTLIMTAILLLFPFSRDWTGFLLTVLLGGGTYGFLVLALNVLNLRGKTVRWVSRYASGSQ